MALIEHSNRSLCALGLPNYILLLLATELGWINVMDVLTFLHHKNNGRLESRATHRKQIENRLICCNGFGTSRVKKVVASLITHDII